MTVLAQILKPYGDPVRGYHNYQHIFEMLANLEQFKELAQDHEMLRIAILFHDVVYEASKGAPYNERSSADEAIRYMADAGYSHEDIEYVDNLIMDTLHRERAETPDGRLMQDLDLLNFAYGDFKVTADSIRKEFWHVPGEQFWPGRVVFLQSMLDREAIYYTPEIAEVYEQQARDNIAAEIDYIENGM